MTTIFCFLLASNITFAQSTASADEFTSKGVSNYLPTEIKDNNEAFFVDADNETYFIDFESLSVNLSELVVKDEAGSVVFKDDVFDLPVNTIYEIDYSEYIAGDYEVELRSFTGVMRKKISVK
ncbi:MAG: hypothetical protein AB8G22_02505 [Saprospiraceae bacterium]